MFDPAVHLNSSDGGLWVFEQRHEASAHGVILFFSRLNRFLSKADKSFNSSELQDGHGIACIILVYTTSSHTCRRPFAWHMVMMLRMVIDEGRQRISYGLLPPAFGRG